MATFTITQQPSALNAYLYPTSNGCDVDCYPFGDIPNYRCVDDIFNSIIRDNDYVWMDGSSKASDMYVMENHGTLTGTINYVQGVCRAKSDKYAPAHDSYYRIVISENSGCTGFDVSRNMPLSTSFTAFTKSWQTNPWTTNAWTWDEIDDLQLGFEASSPSVTVSPVSIEPIADGDRTDIEHATVGYKHWEAVLAERPLTEVWNVESSWQYDLYDFILSGADYSTATLYTMNKFGDYLVTTAQSSSETFIYEWNDGTPRYLDDIDIGGYEVVSDGTYYFIGSYEHIYVLEYDDETNELSVKQDYATDLGSADVQDMVYEDGYLYAACAVAGLKVFSVSEGTLTLVDSELDDGSYNISSIASDSTYIYITDTTGDDVYAYSFNGTSFTQLDDLSVSNMQWGLDCDGGYIFVARGNSGVSALSFDGSTLTNEATQDDGDTYSRLVADDGYIHVGTTTAQKLRVYSYDGDTSTFTLLDTFTDVENPIRNVTSDGQFVFVNGTGGTGIILSFNGSDYIELRDLIDGNLPKYIDDNIVSVTVIAKMGKEYDADDEADIRGRMIIKTHGTEYTSDYWTLEYPKKLYAYTWNDNPNTGTTWTLDEVKALQAGIGLYGDGTKYAACNLCHIIISTTSNISPEIQTSQVYFKINYSPPEETCTLNKPRELSIDHERNNNMLNFWTGNREVYGINRSGKSLVLGGMEYTTSTCTDPGSRIMCIRDFAERGDDIIIDDLDMACYNGTYKIRSFGWKVISTKPHTYEWILELEDTEQ